MKESEMKPVLVPNETGYPERYDGKPSSYGLCFMAEVLVTRFFRSINRQGSSEFQIARAILLSTMQEIVLGIAEPKIYLSALDPGVGKTITLTKFIRSLLCWKYYDNVGVLICVSRLTEVKRLVEEIGVPPDSLAVLTKDEELNKLGQRDVDKGQILITTQQMIESRLDGNSFAQAKAFFYQGVPRVLRLWDEAYLPGKPIALAANDLGSLLSPLSRYSPPLREEVKNILDEVEQWPDGATYTLPDFTQDYGVSLKDIRACLMGNEKQLSIATSLWRMSGRTVIIRNDGLLGNTLVDYYETLPADLAPLVVLDASGRVRETYNDLELSRQNLIRLESAVKRYDPLTVHLWRKGGSKSAWKRNRLRLLEGVVQTIQSKPDERWLVVVHKKDEQVGDIEKDIRNLLADKQDNVSFITWGNHSATNDYKDVPNVILAGTLFQRRSQYEALKRLSAGRSASEGQVSKTERDGIELGEHKHNLLQALCRGRVRGSEGQFCLSMDAYIIASDNSLIEEAVSETFPGCRIVDWEPVKRTIRGKVKEAVMFLEQWLVTSQDDFIRFKTISKALNMRSPDFTKSIRHHPDFQKAITELGLMEHGSNVRMTGFLRAASVFHS